MTWTPEDIDKALADNPDLREANFTQKSLSKGNPMPAISNLSPDRLARLRKEVGIMSTHHARRTYSELCGRTFDSKSEARYGEKLRLMERAGEIEDLRYQVRFELFDKPKITITLDFSYLKDGKRVFEDVKGVRFTKKRRLERPRVERDFLVKLHWLKQRYGISVNLVTE